MSDTKPPDDDGFSHRLDLVAQAFSPSTPITTKELFRGRVPQLNRLIDITAQRGQHALLYGERGVGKTSLARVVHGGRESQGNLCVYHTCDSSDRFSSIWRSVFDEVAIAVTHPGVGFAAEDKRTVQSASAYLPPEGDLSPTDVRRGLALLGRVAPCLITIDEFDRLSDPMTHLLMADLIKILSDQAMPATIVLVGVGETVTDVLSEHESIGRSLVQIHMPTMSNAESLEIVTEGMKACRLGLDFDFAMAVVRIAQGLPHYTHLIAQHAARRAVEYDIDEVDADAVQPAVQLAMEDISRTVRETYHRATFSNRDTIYKEVLLACALAQKDDLSEFGSADLREPLRMLTGRRYEIPAFSAHLSDFSSTGARGGVLRKTGASRFRYRFIDPLLPPYVLMRGLADGHTIGT